MKSYIIVFTLFLAFVIGGCGASEELEEMKKAVDMVKDMPEKAEKISNRMEIAKKRYEERKAKGDTIAMNYKELQEYLPKSISGYGEPKLSGQTTNTMGISISNAEALFQKEGDNKGRIKIELVDHTAGYGAFMAAATWLTGYSFENDNRVDKTFETGMDDVFGFESYGKKNKRAELTYALGYRFIINITGYDQEGTDFLKDVAKKIDLKKLAKM